LGSSAKALIKDYGGRTSKGSQTDSKESAHPKVSLTRPTATSEGRLYTQDYSSEGIIWCLY